VWGSTEAVVERIAQLPYLDFEYSFEFAFYLPPSIYNEKYFLALVYFLFWSFID
jgi:hypothetical protein